MSGNSSNNIWARIKNLVARDVQYCSSWRDGIGTLGANPCGELRCSVLSPLLSAQGFSIPVLRGQFGVFVPSAWLGLHQLGALHPNLLQVPFLLVKIPPSAQTLVREGGKSPELVEPLLLGCCFIPGSCGSRWVPGFCSAACCQSQLCRGFHSPGLRAFRDFTPLWALTCAAVLGQLPGPGKCSEKRNHFMCSALLTGPKKSRRDLSGQSL